jgi:hypothetical protein
VCVIWVCVAWLSVLVANCKKTVAFAIGLPLASRTYPCTVPRNVMLPAGS